MQHPDLAVQQLEDGIKKLGLRGMSVGGSVEGLEIADPKFHPIWAKAEESAVSSSSIRSEPRNWRRGSKATAASKTPSAIRSKPRSALSHLIYEGTLDRFPGLKICAAHGGGYLPFYAPRSDAICVTFPDRCASVP